MKTSFFKLILAGIMLFGMVAVYAQLPSIQYYRYNDKRGLNVFETSKKDTVKYDNLKLRVGGDFAFQLQGISHENAAGIDPLVELANNFALPTANLNFDAQLEDGVRMHLRVYLSSRHHEEAWVKGGYLQFDKLDFISPGFLGGFMDIATIKVGMDEINYGDTHFRRSDNARAIYNPFVGNYIMDSFTTEPYMEVTVQSNGIIGVVGVTNGRLNQSPTNKPGFGGSPADKGRVFYGKLGYDKQMNDDLRLRLTGSFYSSSSGSSRDYLYAGDRAGARYYNVIESIANGGSDFDPRFSPGFGYLTAIQINPFVKYGGLEFFGVYEIANNGDGDVGGGFDQIGAELLYRFGATEQLFVGGRFNSVSGNVSDGTATQDIKRTNFGFGWFLTNNVAVKTEYVTNKYEGDGWNGTKFQDAQFDGYVIEATIGF
ncbi:hypothetical protein [Ekhidna sp.]|uniref:hypothetical protein n=1 Tax=Ekhidna sp. TaxID=2608089 RepID=UPI003297E35E